MTMNKIKRNPLLTIICLFFLTYFPNLGATSHGEFYPLSAFEKVQKEKIIACYSRGRQLDKLITKLPSCDNRNILYTQLGDQKNVVVVSGLYPVTIPHEFSQKGKSLLSVEGFCLPQILLNEESFSVLTNYTEVMNTYEAVKKDLLPTAAGKNPQLDKRALRASHQYHKSLKCLSDRFSAYQKAFLSYMDHLQEYIHFLEKLRGISDETPIKTIEQFKKQISQLIPEKVTQIKTIFDESLVGAVNEYAHSETATLYYFIQKLHQSLPSLIFTTRDMCPVCEDVLVKITKGSPLIVVSTKEHILSWTRHTKDSPVKKVVIDTGIEKFNNLFSSLTDPSKRQIMMDEYAKLLSPRH